MSVLNSAPLRRLYAMGTVPALEVTVHGTKVRQYGRTVGQQKTAARGGNVLYRYYIIRHNWPLCQGVL